MTAILKWRFHSTWIAWLI